MALAEAAYALGGDRYGRAVNDGLETLRASVNDVQDNSLYFGLAGVAFTLRALGRPEDATRALRRVRTSFDGQRWSPMFELLSGNAGIGLGALHAGDLELAVMAVIPYLTTADRTTHGVNWAVRPTAPRSHHLAHGTLGIVYALAAIGDAAGRNDLVELALAGAADVVSRNEAGPDGFLVAHSDPPHRPDLIERYSFGWCNGPAGDAQVFRLLAKVTKDSTWNNLVDRCWHTVIESGIPRRLRPGFWDNNGRCCGTAGVLALACDRIVEQGDGWRFADVLVDDLMARATVDNAGVHWSNRTMSTGRLRRCFDRDPDGRWATLASSESYSAMRNSGRASVATTPSSGPTNPLEGCHSPSGKVAPNGNIPVFPQQIAALTPTLDISPEPAY